MKLINQLWAFFASVQLAIFTLCSIAITSIIGTIIPQGEVYSVYVNKFGAKTATFFQLLDIPTMYSSWWFYGLLGLLSVNLIVCSLDRLPAVWRIVTADNLTISPERIAKMNFSRQWLTSFERVDSIDWQAILTSCGWRNETKNLEEISLFFCQKGRWSRIGVYIVHMSVLVIFAGAIIGHFFGFKGSIMIPELRSTEKVFTPPNSTPIDLGFTIRNDSFAIEFYSNGMPKEFRTSATILENGREMLRKDIKVNSPLTHRGITFYQSSYQGHQEFLAQITDTATHESRQFSLPFQEQISWDEKNLRLGIINVEANGQRALRSKIWCKVGDEPAITQWLTNNETLSIKSGGKDYSLKVKQLFSTGLQVAKDPGVWVVYAGCGLLLLGLYMAFFLSHKRIWLCQQITATGVLVYLAGSTNRNKPAFVKVFARLEEIVDRTLLYHESDAPQNQQM
ncbi:MAG: cytochrome c biogenesis protein ResB [Pseudomonadota bacterium]